VNKNNNSGIAIFEIDEETLKPSGLKYQFMNLASSYGQAEAPTYDQMEFWELDMNKQYGFNDLTAAGFNAFYEKLKADEKLTQDWLVRKIGFRPEIESEYDAAMDIYVDIKLVSKTKHHPDLYYCLMN